ncbi:hypothetical protein VNO78_22668 [Psophocarpus tetragonolobus]|uniref:Glutaredoxin domain-containing protein n=1 Tax=Psophocarpus tetragonolobus TaxID=3891 RepID=A0AAN9XCY5_PSOTE
MERVTKMVSERPVVIFSKSSCCMSHTIKTLFCDFGVNPSVHELDEIPRGRDIEQALSRLGCSPSVPAVFIGGELIGGANEVMSLHLNRSLIPMLKKAGALWVSLFDLVFRSTPFFLIALKKEIDIINVNLSCVSESRTC